MTDFRKVLLAVCPHGKPEIIDGFAASLPSCIDYAEISTRDRLAVFIGQCAEESAGFQTTIEYASGRAYDGRRDLGNVEPGDGPRFKGRGLIQITGRANYAAASKEMGVDFIADPAKLATFPYAAWAADRYWKMRNINAAIDRVVSLADKARVATRIVNGGYNGLAVRQRFTKAAFASLFGYSAAQIAPKASDALADPKGALTKAAVEQKAKAESNAKAATASIGLGGSAAIVGNAPTTATHAALGAPVEWALVVAGAALVGLALWLFLSIRKHQNAAAALTAAAQGA